VGLGEKIVFYSYACLMGVIIGDKGEYAFYVGMQRMKCMVKNASSCWSMSHVDG
jgi:hypothetical protein